MQRFQIVHRTYYNYQGSVHLGAHTLRLRPREGHELRIESSTLHIRPPANLHWYRDAENNSVAIASFNTPTTQLAVESNLIIQQYNQAPLDFLIADYAVDYPFAYCEEDRAVLAPYMQLAEHTNTALLSEWIAGIWRQGEPLQTYGLMHRICHRIHETLPYRMREEPGVHAIEETLANGGSCRDFAFLFMEAARHLGIAARFVTGYLHTPPSEDNHGATHAWAEVFLPGAGWKGFDPTLGEIAGRAHIAVAVARLPESVPPIEGTYAGPPGSTLDVGVWVSELFD